MSFTSNWAITSVLRHSKPTNASKKYPQRCAGILSKSGDLLCGFISRCIVEPRTESDFLSASSQSYSYKADS